jgi:peroxiredoxin
MVHIREKHDEFRKRGAGVAVILAQNPDRMRDYLAENSFPFPLLADASRKVVKEYGVYVRVNFESVNIARPANFVLDAEGVIHYIFIASVQVETPDDRDIFDAIERAAG